MNVNLFPRSRERGPIEATKLLVLGVACATFPRSRERGPIEASIVPGREYHEDANFRAHVSAAPLKPSLATGTGFAVSYFRAHVSAAPLKHSAAQAPADSRKYFRAHVSAAPLKQ